MSSNKHLRRLSFGPLAFALSWIGLFSGCQTQSSEPDSVVTTPTDSTKIGSKDSVKADPNDKATLSLVSPQGGSYSLGDSLHIKATIEGNGRGTINAIEVLLSPDGGQTWGGITDHPVPVDAHSDFDFSWKIPATFIAGGKPFSLAENKNCMVRVAQHNTGDSLKASVGGRFTIEDTLFIRLTHPLGGESFHVGDTLPITWTTKDDTNDPIDAVDVQISADSGKTWGYLRVNSIPPDSPLWGRFPWVVTESIRILGNETHLVGNPGVCLRVQQYSTADPKRRFQSGMISISASR